MKLPYILGIRRARDKQKDSYGGAAYSFFFGRSTSGKNVNERTAMQTTACIPVFFSNIEQQSLEFVKYTLDPWVRSNKRRFKGEQTRTHRDIDIDFDAESETVSQWWSPPVCEKID